MAQTVIGRNNFTTTGSGRNTIEDDNVNLRGRYAHEGIISGCRVTEADTPTTGVKIDVGELVVDVQGDEFLYFQLKTTEVALALPGTPTTNVRYLVAFKVDLTNLTGEPVIIEGTAGTDPDLTETANPKVGFLPMARINFTTGNVLDSMIVQDGVTVTNNSNVEIIGRNAQDGWHSFNATATYASADAPSFEFTLPGDFTAHLQPGMRFKLTQTTAKYFILTKVVYSAGVTTCTVYGGTDYTLVNAAITNLEYALPKTSPVGFPLEPTKWTETLTSSSIATQATPTNGVVYNPGSLSIDGPIGSWDVFPMWTALITDTNSTDMRLHTALSTSNSSVSDFDLVASTKSSFSSGVGSEARVNMSRYKNINLASKTTYYPVVFTSVGGINSIGLESGPPNTGNILCLFVCAYL